MTTYHQVLVWLLLSILKKETANYSVMSIILWLLYSHAVLRSIIKLDYLDSAKCEPFTNFVTSIQLPHLPALPSGHWIKVLPLVNSIRVYMYTNFIYVYCGKISRCCIKFKAKTYNIMSFKKI